MKKIIVIIIATICSVMLTAQDLSQFKALSTSLRFSRLLGAYNPRIAIAKQSWEADGHIDELYPMPEGKVGPGFVQPEVFEGDVIFVQSERTYSSVGTISCKFFARPDADHMYDKTLVPDVAIDLGDKVKAWEEILQIIDNKVMTSK